MSGKKSKPPFEIFPVPLLSDNPERKSMKFGFDSYARTIAGVIANKNNETPMVIGIYGQWGSGKTTLMKSVVDLFETEALKDSDKFRKVKSVWFQAWKHCSCDEILAALIEQIFRTMKNDSIWNHCKANLEELVKSINFPKAIKKIGEEFLGADDIFDFMNRLEYKNKLGFYDTFQDFFDRLLWIYLRDRPKLNLKEQPNDTDGVLAIFVDDLDRCPQDRIVCVLETIKLFMDKPGCVFVIGAAEDIIEKSLRKIYDDDAKRFMDKIVQVSFNLPVIQADGFSEMIDELSIEQKEHVKKSLPLLVPVVEHNPRRLKRLINNLHLQIGINQNRGNPIKFEHLFNWAIIEYVYPSFAETIRNRSDIMFLLKDEIAKVSAQKGIGREIEFTEVDLKDIADSLKSFIKNGDLRQIVTNFDCTKEELDQLISLSSIFKSSEEIQTKGRDSIWQEFDKMVKIPAGKFFYGEDKKEETIEQPFEIDIYPVTNSQYKRFIYEKGYENMDFWSKEGVDWLKKNSIIQPLYWVDEKYNKSDYPVVGVSFFEAEAYTKWAAKRLPTEIEWERGARGSDGREFPWGNEFDKNKCNCKESGIGHPSSVTQYPDGRSPNGCYDMVGNVWEWCSNIEAPSARVVRGCSWDGSMDLMRCAHRYRFNPDHRNSDVGFRCVR